MQIAELLNGLHRIHTPGYHQLQLYLLRQGVILDNGDKIPVQCIFCTQITFEINGLPKVIEFVEDSGGMIKDIDLACGRVEPSHVEAAWKRSDKESADRVQCRHLIRQ